MESTTCKDFFQVQTKGKRSIERLRKQYLHEFPNLGNYLVFAEGQAMRRIPMYMKDWNEKLMQSRSRTLVTGLTYEIKLLAECMNEIHCKNYNALVDGGFDSAKTPLDDTRCLSGVEGNTITNSILELI